MEISYDRSVKQETADGSSTTFLEGDGSIIRITEDAEVFVPADRAELPGGQPVDLSR